MSSLVSDSGDLDRLLFLHGRLALSPSLAHQWRLIAARFIDEQDDMGFVTFFFLVLVVEFAASLEQPQGLAGAPA